MSTREMIRDVAQAITRDIVFQEGLTPSWSVDFINGGLSNGLSLSRASGANYTNQAGAMVTAASNVARLDYNPTTLAPRGLLVEEQRTNSLLNSAAPANQTVTLAANTYTLWVVGSGSCAVAAGTAVGTGFGIATAGTPLTFTVSTTGNVVFTVSGSLSAFQCENGAFATSFITTTTAAATRAADICTGSIGSWLNVNEGTLVVEYMRGASAASAVIFRLDNGSDGTVVAHGAGTTGGTFANRVAFTTDVSMVFTGVSAAQTIVKQAGAYRLNDYAGSRNGSAVITDTAASMPVGLSGVRLGSRGADSWLNGWIRKVAYYPQRLSNAQLMQLTA